MSPLVQTVKIENFSSSWADGLAFCALAHHFYSDEFDFAKLDSKNRRHNLTLAFETLKYALTFSDGFTSSNVPAEGDCSHPSSLPESLSQSLPAIGR